MKANIGLAALAAGAALATPAHAQPAAGESAGQASTLGQCLVMRTTGADRLALAQWIVSAMASVPKLQDMATVDPARKDKADRAMAAIFTRLMTVDCAKEAKAVMQGGNSAGGVRVAFEALGGIAMQEVVANREAEEAMGSHTRYLDRQAFTELMK